MTIGEAAEGAGAGPGQAAWAGLVGRSDVLAQLRRAVEDAAGGRGRLVLLTGEAGIGKTSVAAQAAADADGRGTRVVWGWGWQGEGAPAWWPWVQVLRSLVAQDPRLGRVAAGASSLARLLPELPGAAAPPATPDEPATAAARFRLLDEVTSVLLAAAEDRPLMVVLEDLQWADPPSLQLLDFLARRLPAARVLVLATWRDLDTPPDDQLAPLLADLAAGSTVVPLRALSEDEVAQLVAGMLGGRPEPALVADLRRRTGGNPFFVQQVTRLLLAQTGTGGPGLDAPAGIPFGVREAVRRRLARLGPACVELVTTAAVAGPEFTAALLTRVTGAPPDAVRDLLEEAARAHVLAGPTGPLRPWRFAHDLFREVVLDGLDGQARARLHLRVGRALEAERDTGGVPPAQLASHFAQAGAEGEDEAIRYGALAAAEATRRLAHEEAARQWARALEVLDGSARADDGGRRIGLLLELAAARRRAGDLAGSRQACARVAELARRAADPDGLARAALAMQAVGSRSWPTLVRDTVPLLEEAAAALDDRDTPLRARVLAGLARELAWNGMDLARAARFADAAIAAARAAGDRATLAACLLARHNAGWRPGNAADRLALATQIVELAGDGRDLELLAEARLLRTADLLELADPGFQAELAEFLRVAGELEQPRLRYAALARRAMQALLAGRVGEAERLVAEAVALGQEIGEPDVADVEHAQLWELRGLQGRRAELLALGRALFGDDSPAGRGFLALTLLEQGDRAGAEAAAGPPSTWPPRRRYRPTAAGWRRSPSRASWRPPWGPGRPASGCTRRCSPTPRRPWPSGWRSPSGARSPTTWACWPRPWTGPRRPGPTSSTPWPSTSASAPGPGRPGASMSWPGTGGRMGARPRPGARCSGATGRCGPSPTPAGPCACGTPRASATWPPCSRPRAGRSRPRSWSPRPRARRPCPPTCGWAPTRCSTTAPARSSGPASSTSRRKSRRPTAGTTRNGPPGPPWNGTPWWPSWPPPPASAAGPGGSATSRNGPARPSPPGSAT